MISVYNTYTTSKDEHCISVNRTVDVFLIALFLLVIGLHLLTLSEVVAKNHEIVDKFDAKHEVADNEVCIFCIDDLRPIGDSGVCNFVIFGSGALASCALVMVVLLVMRIMSHRKLSILCVVDLVEILVTGLLAILIATAATDGTTTTCDTLTHNTGHSHCSDVYLYGHSRPIVAIRFYPALITTVMTSWSAVVILSVIAMVTMARVLVFTIRRHAVDREVVTLVKYDKLQDVDSDD